MSLRNYKQWAECNYQLICCFRIDGFILKEMVYYTFKVLMSLK